MAKPGDPFAGLRRSPESIALEEDETLREFGYAPGSPALLILEAAVLPSPERLRALQAGYAVSGYWPLEIRDPLNQICGLGALKGDAAVAKVDLLDAQAVLQSCAERAAAEAAEVEYADDEVPRSPTRH